MPRLFYYKITTFRVHNRWKTNVLKFGPVERISNSLTQNGLLRYGSDLICPRKMTPQGGA